MNRKTIDKKSIVEIKSIEGMFYIFEFVFVINIK